MITLLFALTAGIGGDDPLDAASRSFADSLAPNNAVHLGVLLRTRFAASHDIDESPAPGRQDLAGFTLDVARISLFGELDANYSYYVSLEGGEAAQQDSPFAGAGVSLLDAWGKAKLGEYASLKLGQFCMRFLMSTCIDERDLLFLDRSYIGESMDNRDRGAELSGAIERFEWWAAVQNGFDGVAKDSAFTARARYRLIGDGACDQEGACGMKGDSLALDVGWYDDESMDHGTVVAGDVYFVHEGWSASAEIANYGDDMRPMPSTSPTTGIVLPGMGGATGSKSPWSVTLGYAIPETNYQLAGRFQKLDDMDDTSIASFVVSEVAGSTPCRISLQYDKASSNNAALDVETIAFGLTVSL